MRRVRRYLSHLKRHHSTQIATQVELSPDPKPIPKISKEELVEELEEYDLHIENKPEPKKKKKGIPDMSFDPLEAIEEEAKQAPPEPTPIEHHDEHLEVHPHAMGHFEDQLQKALKMEASILRKIRDEEKRLEDMSKNFDFMSQKMHTLARQEHADAKKLTEFNRKLETINHAERREKQELADVAKRLDDLFKHEAKHDKHIDQKLSTTSDELIRMEEQLKYLEQMQSKLAVSGNDPRMDSLKKRIMDSQRKISHLKK